MTFDFKDLLWSNSPVMDIVTKAMANDITNMIKDFPLARNWMNRTEKVIVLIIINNIVLVIRTKFLVK